MPKFNSYWAIINKMNQQGKFQYRYELVIFATNNGIKPAAREFKTTVPTVRKWLKRYRESGISGLKELSRKPHRSPNKCPEEFEQKVIAIRKQTKNKFGGLRLMKRFKLEHGKNCIQRIIRQNGLAQKRKKKYEKQNHLRAVKRVMKAFEKIQVDVKELKDIANYYPQMLYKGLPKYEITARDVKSGATFVCLANKNNSTNAASFLAYLLEHLQNTGVELKEVTIQADNGAEFFACGNNKYTQTPFEKMIHHYGCKVSRIPPRAPTFNSDVETFHRLGEDEFWAIEDFENTRDLQDQFYSFMFDFNFVRTNCYKEEKTPFQLITEDYPSLSENVLLLPVLVMDNHIDYLLNKTAEPVPEVTKKQGRADPFLDLGQAQFLSRWGYDVSGFHK